MSEFILREAEPKDAAALLEIYRPFVESKDHNISDVSFEYKAPNLQEWLRRMKKIRTAFPYLLAENADGTPVGYAYAHPYIERAAYHGNAELTVYLAPQAQGQGLGPAFYNVLEIFLVNMGAVNAYACVTASNEHSVAMHKALGYQICGSFPRSGFKKGHWLDMIWLSKQIAPYPKRLPMLKKFCDLPQDFVKKILTTANTNLARRQREN